VEPAGAVLVGHGPGPCLSFGPRGLRERPGTRFNAVRARRRARRAGVPRRRGPGVAAGRGWALPGSRGAGSRGVCLRSTGFCRCRALPGSVDSDSGTGVRGGGVPGAVPSARSAASGGVPRTLAGQRRGRRGSNSGSISGERSAAPAGGSSSYFQPTGPDRSGNGPIPS